MKPTYSYRQSMAMGGVLPGLFDLVENGVEVARVGSEFQAARLAAMLNQLTEQQYWAAVKTLYPQEKSE